MTSRSEIESLEELEKAALEHDYWYSYASGPSYDRGVLSAQRINAAVQRLGEPAEKFWRAFCLWRDGGSKGDAPRIRCYTQEPER